MASERPARQDRASTTSHYGSGGRRCQALPVSARALSPAGPRDRLRRVLATERPEPIAPWRRRDAGGRLIAAAAVLFAASLIWSQCSAPAPRAPSPAALLGDMKAVVSVKELMADMIDPLADNIFDAVRWDSGPQGMEEHRPRTDEDWEKVSVGAVTLAEGIYLLKVPRPFAPAGDENN